MTKSTLISITLVAAAVVAAIGYQSFTSEPESVEAIALTSPVAQQAQASAKPVAPVSMSAPSASETVSGSAATDLVASPDAKPSAVNDPSHPPRQAPNANRAPRSAPNANPEYAHHPRPGTEQPVSAPVSMPSQAPVK
ncbi:hypothetical protein [Shewanella benthica]|uniref:Uncharacterized protein n=1 Tax=Shewanella benthica KT99 TaxID=314608 RepID=A9DE39_9GAMM|nr:hypothetical protein [Shewanella benthica]EDQ00091.1 hypothetical protein KT99_19309 [Shewanella benthica KT99]